MERETLEFVETLKLVELCQFCGLEQAKVVAMVEYGILSPWGDEEAAWTFDGASIQRAVKARRLERDLGLNEAGIALVLDLLDERAVLLRQLGANGD